MLTNAPGLLDVGANLGEQFVQARERLGAAQPRQEIELDLLAVKIAVEADQMRFHRSSMLAEGGVGPDVARGRPGRDGVAAWGIRVQVQKSPSGINAIRGNERIDVFKVDGRDSDPGAAAGAVSDDSSDPVRTAQELRCFIDACLRGGPREFETTR